MRSLRELQSLNGRCAMITGGAGHLGKAMARALLELDCIVCLVDVSDEALEQARAHLGAEPAQLLCFTANLESGGDREALYEVFSATGNRLDILINNAAFVGDSGLQGWATRFQDQSIDTWRRALEVNLTAPFHLTQLFAPMLRAHGCGSIVNIGSIYGVLGPDLTLYEGTPMGNPGAYAASKGGLVQLTRWLATTLAPDCRVNSISPGGLQRGQPIEFASRYAARTPLGRMGVEEDFLGVVAFLASDMSSWVTGQNIMVDGGWTAW